jgi:hypothetical protein
VDVVGAGEARELALEPGLFGLVERVPLETDERRRDVVRPSPVLPVRACPTAGRTVTGGRYSQVVNALFANIYPCDVHYLVVRVV